MSSTCATELSEKKDVFVQFFLHQAPIQMLLYITQEKYLHYGFIKSFVFFTIFVFYIEEHGGSCSGPKLTSQWACFDSCAYLRHKA